MTDRPAAPAPRRTPLLEAVALSKRFGALVATRDLTLTVHTGELHALIGPNGAGKTTAMAQLSGELECDGGTIVFRGEDVTRLPVDARARRGLARSYQITSVFEGFSVEDNVALAVQARQGHSFRFWRRAAGDPSLRAPARNALERVGLGPSAHALAATLSHADKRRLEVAMAIAQDPLLLLLDEPMAGLGHDGTQSMQALLQSLKGELTILLVEHDMDVVFSLADVISVLVAGERIACGDPRTIRADARVRKAYLGNGD